MPPARPLQARSLMIQIACRAWREQGVWVAACPALGLSDQGRTLPEARQRLLTMLDLFLTDCSERGALEDALRARQVPFSWIETSSPDAFDPAAGIQFLTALTGDPQKSADYPEEQVKVIVPAIAQGRVHAGSGSD